jgi:hypothetical protein
VVRRIGGGCGALSGVSEREGKGREGKGREGKGREGKGREGKGGMEEKLLSRSRVRGERDEFYII